MCFMNLENSYDRMHRRKMWLVLKKYVVKNNLLHGIKSFYENSRACVRVKRKDTDFIGVEVGLRKRRVMSPWLFNVFIDSAVRNMDRNEKEVELISPDGKCG